MAAKHCNKFLLEIYRLPGYEDRFFKEGVISYTIDGQLLGGAGFNCILGVVEDFLIGTLSKINSNHLVDDFRIEDINPHNIWGHWNRDDGLTGSKCLLLVTTSVYTQGFWAFLIKDCGRHYIASGSDSEKHVSFVEIEVQCIVNEIEKTIRWLESVRNEDGPSVRS